jgi:hypothetical protein
MNTKIKTALITLIAAGSFATAAAPVTFAADGGCTVEHTDSKGGKSTINMQDGASITLGKAELTCTKGNVTVKPAAAKAIIVQPPVKLAPSSSVVTKAAKAVALG